MTLKGQGHRFKTNGTMRFIDLENIYLDVKIIILCALLSKLWSKTSFCIMAANVTRSRTSHVQTAQDIFWFVESPRPKLPCVKFGDDLSSRNRGMAQNVILHICDLERSRSNTRSIKFCTAMRTLPMSIHAKFRWNLMASCLDTVNKSWPGERKKERKKEEE